MRVPCVCLPAVVALAILAKATPARADYVLLNNLDQAPRTGSVSAFIGQSFIAGTVDQTLQAAQMQLAPTHTPSANIRLNLEARNPDGTVGATLFSDFSSSYNATTGLVTYRANSNFTLSAGTGYWLVLSDPTAGGVVWNFTSSNVYQSNFGYGLPSTNTSWTSDQNNGQGNSTYYQPSDGPQIFSLLTVVPEPSSFLLLGAATAAVGLAGWFKRARPVF